jgi:hypothetical protein
MNARMVTQRQIIEGKGLLSRGAQFKPSMIAVKGRYVLCFNYHTSYTTGNIRTN